MPSDFPYFLKLSFEPKTSYKPLNPPTYETSFKWSQISTFFTNSIQN